MARLSPSQEDIYAVSRLHAHVTTWFRNNWAGNWQHHGAHFTGFEKIHNKSSFFEDVKEEIDKRLIRKYGLTAANKKAISTDSIRRFLLQQKNSFDDKVMEAFLALVDPGMSWSEYREKTFSATYAPSPSRQPGRMIIALATLLLVLAGTWWYFQKQGRPDDLSLSATVLPAGGFPKAIRVAYDLRKTPYRIARILVGDERINLQDAKGEHTVHSFIPKKLSVKLFLDDQKVKEQVIVVPSEGWFGSINNRIALPKESFLQNGVLQFIASEEMKKAHEETYSSFMYFEEFDIDADNFTLSAEVVNNADIGGVWAYDVSVDVLGTEGNMTFNLLSPDAMVYSRLKVADTDFAEGKRSYVLSQLGVKLDDWSALEVTTKNNTFRLSLNGKVRIQESFEGKLGRLTGIQFYLKGTGAVKNVRVQESGKALVSL